MAPLMQRLGVLWHAGALRTAQEHVASEVVRHFRWNMRRGFAPSISGAHVLVTTAAGQWHEIGALMAAALRSTSPVP